MIGFESLTDDGCLRLLAIYTEGVEAHERGEVNYPCGSPVRTVRRWMRELRAETEKRGLDLTAPVQYKL